MPSIVATYVYASSQGQHTHSARTNKVSKKKEREKNALNSGHLVPWQRTQAARTNLEATMLPYSGEPSEK